MTCNVDHSSDMRPAVLGGECALCLHVPPLHEPTCQKAKCTCGIAEPATDDELAEVERLDREATPGPWTELYVDDSECIRLLRREGEQADTLGMTAVDSTLACRARTLLPKLAAEVRANRAEIERLNGAGHLACDEVLSLRKSLDKANAALKRVASDRDALSETTADLRARLSECVLRRVEIAQEARERLATERDRVRRLFDHHLTGRVVDDDTRQRLEAFVRDVASGTDRRPA